MIRALMFGRQVETAYDRFVKMEPQCNLGGPGLPDLPVGPCRITKAQQCAEHTHILL